MLVGERLPSVRSAAALEAAAALVAAFDRRASGNEPGTPDEEVAMPGKRART
jgi:hypothetical protein